MYTQLLGNSGMMQTPDAIKVSSIVLRLVSCVLSACVEFVVDGVAFQRQTCRVFLRPRHRPTVQAIALSW